MIQSMTGYGKAEAQTNGKNIHVEIKSLNSKALDLSTRIATPYKDMEMDIRALIGQTLERGKIDLILWAETNKTTTPNLINETNLQAYHRQILSACEKLNIPHPADSMTILLRLPDVIEHNEPEPPTDDERATVIQAVNEAINKLIEFRTQEGAALTMKFKQNIQNISNLLHSLEQYEHERIRRIRQRIEENLETLATKDYDRGRLEQEMIYYIEKLDINEEKQRLTNHLDYFLQTMADGHGQGKKLGFIAQEMGREINTTGSKSNMAEMQNIVVKMKDELEQIKEQVLNVL